MKEKKENSNKNKKRLKESAGEVINELIDKLLEDHEKLEKIDDRIMKIEITERLNMKEIESEIHNEIKIFYNKINMETKKISF